MLDVIGGWNEALLELVMDRHATREDALVEQGDQELPAVLASATNSG